MPKEPRRTVGRPSKLTPEIQKAICKALELSVPEKHAAQANGISESTFHDWMKKGADGIEPYAAFREAVEQSTSQAVINLTVRALARGNGSSHATWFLERRFRNEYGSRVLVGGVADAAPISLENDLKIANTICASPEAVKKLHEAIAIAVAEDAKRIKKLSDVPCVLPSGVDVAAQRDSAATTPGSRRRAREG